MGKGKVLEGIDKRIREMMCHEFQREKEGDGDRGRLIDEDKAGDVKGPEISVIRKDIMVKIEQENQKNGGLCSADLLKLK